MDAHSEGAGRNRSRVLRRVHRQHAAGRNEDHLHKVDELRRQLGPGDDAQREPEHQPGAGHRHRSSEPPCGPGLAALREPDVEAVRRHHVRDLARRRQVVRKSDGPRQHLFLHAGDDVGELPHHDTPVHHIRRHRLPRHLGRAPGVVRGNPDRVLTDRDVESVVCRRHATVVESGASRHGFAGQPTRTRVPSGDRRGRQPHPGDVARYEKRRACRRLVSRSDSGPARERLRLRGQDEGATPIRRHLRRRGLCRPDADVWPAEAGVALSVRGIPGQPDATAARAQQGEPSDVPIGQGAVPRRLHDGGGRPIRPEGSDWQPESPG